MANCAWAQPPSKPLDHWMSYARSSEITIQRLLTFERGSSAISAMDWSKSWKAFLQVRSTLPGCRSLCGGDYVWSVVTDHAAKATDHWYDDEYEQAAQAILRRLANEAPTFAKDSMRKSSSARMLPGRQTRPRSLARRRSSDFQRGLLGYIRAMEIINELEPVARSVYAGSIGCIDRGGSFDTNITIRALVFTPSQFTHGAAAGFWRTPRRDRNGRNRPQDR